MEKSVLFDDQLLQGLVRRCDLTTTLLRRQQEEIITALVPVASEVLEQAVRDLIGDQEREPWLQHRNWTEDDLRLCASRPLALEAFARQRFGPGLEEHFLSSRGGRDEIVYSLLRVRDAGLARELYLRLAEGELPFPEAARQFGEGPEARHQGLIGPMRLGQLQPQQLADALRGLQPGELAKPLVLGEWHLILRLEHFSPARLDEAMRHTLLQEQLDAFLDERVKRLQAGESLEPLQYDCEDNVPSSPGSSAPSDLT